MSPLLSDGSTAKFSLCLLGTSSKEQQPAPRNDSRSLSCDSCSPGEVPSQLNLPLLPSLHDGRHQSESVHTVPERVPAMNSEVLVLASLVMGPEVVCSNKVISNCVRRGLHTISSPNVPSLWCLGGRELAM